MEQRGGTGRTGGTGNVDGTGSTGRAVPLSAGHRLLGTRRAVPGLLTVLSLALALPPLTRGLPASPDLPRHILPVWLNRSRELLAAANGAVQRLKESGTLGFECTLEEVDLEDITKNQSNTIRACTAEDPKAGNCPVLESSTFNMGWCLQGIYGDLDAYRAELENLDDQTVLAAIDEMMKVLGTSSRNESQPSAGVELANFKERMRLCSILQAFRIRMVTINRLMSYLRSPEFSL